MNNNKLDLKKIHNKCTWHKEEILKSKVCGCFYCLTMFPPSDIDDWLDELEDDPKGKEVTALCPKCGIDSVLPQSYEYQLSQELLKQMKRYFFY